MEGIRRVHGKPKRKTKGLRLEHIAKMIDHLSQLPNTQKKSRNLAIILTGFFWAFRRSELVGITVEDLHWEPEGLIIQLSKSKTDQAGQGLTRACLMLRSRLFVLSWLLKDGWNPHQYLVDHFLDLSTCGIRFKTEP